MDDWGRLDPGTPIRSRALLRDPARLLLLGSAVLITAGSILPWVSGTSEFVGRISWNGMDGKGDGGVLSFLAILLAAYGLWGQRIVDSWAPVRYVPGLLMAMVVPVYVVAFRETARLISEGVGVGRLEIGLYVVGLGLVLGVPGAVLTYLEARSPG